MTALKTVCIFGLILSLAAVPVVAQECDRLNEAVADASRFDVNDNGTVTDIVSGLTWMRCMVGQQWDGSQCIGKARRFSWGEAKTAGSAPMLKANGGPNTSDVKWRLPRVNELASIVDIRCYSPRVNLDLFPATEAAPYWTTNNVPGLPGQAFTLSFGKEGVARTDKSEKHYVRLVYGRE